MSAPRTDRERRDPVTRGLQRLRVLAAAAIVVAAAGMRPEEERLTPLVVAGVGAVVVCLLVLNLLDRLVVRRDGRASAVVVLVQVGGDTLLAVAAPWLLAADLASPATMVAALPVLEAGLRFRVLGAAAGWFATSSLLFTRLLLTADTIDRAILSELGQVSLVLLVVTLPATYLAEHLAGELSAAGRARRAAGQRAALLELLTLVTRDLHALDLDRLHEVVVDAAERLGCRAADLHRLGPDGRWELLRRREAPREARIRPVVWLARARRPLRSPAVPPMPPPSVGWSCGRLPDAGVAPGWRLGQVGLDTGGQPLLLRTLVPAGASPLVDQAIEILAAEAAIALRNAELHRRLELLAAEHEWRAVHDPLTGLRNRSGVMQELETLFEQRPRPPVAVLFIDLDGFKEVNDVHGHAAGDVVLAESAARIAAHAGPEATVARFGGDEFLVLHHGADAHRRAAAAQPEIGRALAAPIGLGTRSVAIGASIGFSHVGPDEPSTPDRLLHDADARMYAVKEGRRAAAEGAPLRTPSRAGRPPIRSVPRGGDR